MKAPSKKNSKSFQKGKPKTGGRKPGVKNKKTADVNNMIDRALGIIDSRLDYDVNKLSPTRRIQMMENLLEYRLPKRSRVDETGETPTEIKVTIERTNPSKEDDDEA